MNDHNAPDSIESAECADRPERDVIARRVRAALDAPQLDSAEGGAAARVLSRIAGRSPRELRDQGVALQLRRATIAAAALLAALAAFGRVDRDAPSANDQEQLFSAVTAIALDDDDLEGGATSDGVVSDLFDVEVPE